MAAATAIARLRQHLAGDPAQHAGLAAVAGVNPRLVRRAAKGIDINADAYLKLCAAVGFDPVTWAAGQQGSIGDLDWNYIALALKGQRILRDHTIAKAKKAIGKISDSTISRVENGNVCSIDHLLLICGYIARHPFSLTAFPVKQAVKDADRKQEMADA